VPAIGVIVASVNSIIHPQAFMTTGVEPPQDVGVMMERNHNEKKRVCVGGSRKGGGSGRTGRLQVELQRRGRGESTSERGRKRQKNIS